MRQFDRGQVQVTNLAHTEALPDLLTSLRAWGWTVWHLDGSQVRDADTLFARSGIDLPSPFPLRTTTGFDSFADSLREAAATSADNNIALVWTRAEQMLDGGLADLLTAVSVLRQVSQWLAGLEGSAGGPKGFYTFLVGSGPNFS